MKIKESDGTHFDPNTGKHQPLYCPVNAYGCPYCIQGICYIKDPMEDCDDWAFFWDSWEDWEIAQAFSFY